MMNREFLEKNILKIADYLLKNNSEIWSFNYPYFRNFSSSTNFSPKLNNDISLYIHVPFCTSKCKYCFYYWNNDIFKFWSEKYVDLLIKELDFQVRDNANKIYLSSLLIWWWTPTLLESEHIIKLMTKINEHFYVDDNSQLTIESTPWHLSDKKSQAILKSGFNRVSIWIQSFDENILKEQNRYQKNLIVYNAFKNLRDNNIKSINIDLIYWLNKKESVDSFLDSNLEHIIKLNPDSIDIYPNQDFSNNNDLLNYNILDDINYICDYINSKIWKPVAFPQLNIWKKWIDYNINNFPYNRSKYTYDRRILLKQTLSLWYWAIWNFFNDKWDIVFSIFNALTINDYKINIDNNNFLYKYKHLDYIDTIKYYFIRNLRAWINKQILDNLFHKKNQKDYLVFLLNKIKKFINYENNFIFLNDYYINNNSKYINDNIKYFLFVFDNLYEDKDRDDFYKNINNLIKI